MVTDTLVIVWNIVYVLEDASALGTTKHGMICWLVSYVWFNIFVCEFYTLWLH